jgi:hypothetical protein
MPHVIVAQKAPGSERSVGRSDGRAIVRRATLFMAILFMPPALAGSCIIVVPSGRDGKKQDGRCAQRRALTSDIAR